jgi:hypothetical protein
VRIGLGGEGGCSRAVGTCSESRRARGQSGHSPRISRRKASGERRGPVGVSGSSGEESARPPPPRRCSRHALPPLGDESHRARRAAHGEVPLRRCEVLRRGAARGDGGCVIRRPCRTGPCAGNEPTLGGFLQTASNCTIWPINRPLTARLNNLGRPEFGPFRHVNKNSVHRKKLNFFFLEMGA